MATPDLHPGNTFVMLAAAAGVPNAKWQACWDAVMAPNPEAFDGTITGLALMDKAIRTWWRGQGGVILGTVAILTGILNG